MPTTTRKKPAKRATRKPADDRTVEWAKLLDQALNTPGSVGNVYSRFYSYSFLNCLLLMVQGATEPVATYARWQTMERQVRKGEKAKEIVRPIVVKHRDDENDPNSPEHVFQRFKPVRCLFELSQTDGPDLPPVEIPEWNLDTALAEWKINRMPFMILDGNTQGYSQGRSYAINPVAAYPIKTTMHEIAHILLGHTAPEEHEEYKLHRGIREFQAEASAFLALKELEQLSDEAATVSRGYIQSWLRDETPSDQVIRAVFKTVTEIVQAGRRTGTESED